MKRPSAQVNLKNTLKAYGSFVIPEYHFFKKTIWNDLANALEVRAEAMFCKQPSKYDDLLVVGRTGNGSTTAAVALSHSLQIPFILVNAAFAYASKFSSYRIKAAKGCNNYPAQFVYSAFMCAIAMSPCVLILDDLHRLCPSSSSDDTSETIAQVRIALLFLYSLK